MALLSKWWWRFKIDKQGLWRRVVWAFHHNSRSWCDIHVKVSLPGPWKAICKNSLELASEGIDVIKAIKGKLGSGVSILFWLDVWADTITLKEKFPALFAIERSKGCSVSERLFKENGNTNMVFQWNTHELSSAEERELSELTNLLASIQIGEGEDHWQWEIGNEGKFSTQSIKHALHPLNQPVPSPVFLWNNWVPKKVIFLARRTNLDRIATMDALSRRNVVVHSTFCVFCGEYVESVDHIFTGCRLVHSVLEIISKWCRLSPLFVFSVKDLVDHKNFGRGSQK